MKKIMKINVEIKSITFAHCSTTTLVAILLKLASNEAANIRAKKKQNYLNVLDLDLRPDYLECHSRPRICATVTWK